MSLNVLFSNLWGILLHEWRGVDRRTAAVLVTGLLILIFSVIKSDQPYITSQIRSCLFHSFSEILIIIVRVFA